jgi:hypothetical protein
VYGNHESKSIQDGSDSRDPKKEKDTEILTKPIIPLAILLSSNKPIQQFVVSATRGERNLVREGERGD